MSEQCRWIIAWRGQCQNGALPNSQFCAEHDEKSCRVCGDTAVRDCPETTGLVCGEPLCDKCECSWIGD